MEIQYECTDSGNDQLKYYGKKLKREHTRNTAL